MKNLFLILIISLFQIVMGPFAEAGSQAQLFVPNQYAPLSSFKQKTTTVSESLTFNVKPIVAQFVVNNGYSGWIAFQNLSGQIQFLSPTTYNLTTGVVTLTTSQPGKFVVVAEPFTNDFPIVTHWNQQLNSGRGGFQLGATNAIGTLDYIYNSQTQSDQITESTDIYDQDPLNPYLYNTTKYALFSSDPLQPNAKVPGFERYVGENYSINSITDRLATYISLMAVEATGYPVLHRNYPWALYDQAPIAKQVRKNLPAFQVVHNMPFTAEVGVSSLASFILPPLWTNAPTVKYPVLFTGLYDINANFARENGLDFIKVIGQLVNSGVGSAVGILWNGGGALGSQTIQLSSHYNVAYLFEASKSIFGIDANKVVTAGMSRGGSTALAVAANPNFNNYTVKYALSYCPPTLFGEHVSKWISPNYAGVYVNYAWVTGYKYSYMTNWVDPISGLSGNNLFMQNSAGSTDASYLDAISPGGDWMVQALKTKGTKVLLSAGTNDPFIPFDFEMRLYNKLRSSGVPTQFNVGYRFGHNYFTDKKADMVWALTQVMTNSNATVSGLKQYRRQSESGPGFDVAVEFQSTDAIAVSLPRIVAAGSKVKIEAAGNLGLTYAIIYYKIDDNLWNNNRQLVVTGPQNFVTANIFNGLDAFQSQTFDMDIPANLAPGQYIYLVGTSRDQGATWSLVDLTKVPQSTSQPLPIFEVQSAPLSLPAMQLGSIYSTLNRGWGLSSY